MQPSSAAKPSAAPTRDATTAIVVVHGIGPQKPGRLVGSVADGLKGFLDRQANRPVDVRRLSDRIEFLYARRRQRCDVVHRVVLLEAYWADSRLRPGPFRSLAWLVRFGPALIALLFAPGHRDIQHSSAARILYRLALPAVIVVSLGASHRWWLPTLLVVLAACSVAVRRANVVGDVAMATTDEEAVAAITDAINHTIDDALGIAERVIVVGHSQGGYLSHRALSRRRSQPGRPDRIELIGVGSGLKPISLLAALSQRRDLLLTALAVLGGALVSASVLAFALDVASSWRHLFVTTIPATARSLVRGTDGPPPDFHGGPVVPDIPEVVVASAGLTAMALAWAGMRHRLNALRDLALGRPPIVSAWTEATTTADTVGRMAFPQLKDAQPYVVAGVGNPLLDHVSYFHPASPVTWLLARRAFPLVVLRRPSALLPRWERYAEGTVARIRAFSCALSLVLLASRAIYRVDDGSRGFGALTAQAHRPGWLVVWLLLFAAAAPFLGALDRVRLSRALAERPLGLPPKRYTLAFSVRFLLFGLLILLAATVGAAAHDLVPYERLTPSETFWLPIAPRLCQAGTIALACALVAGYRPPLLTLIALVGPILVLATYLPGESLFAWWSFWVVVLLAAFRLLTRWFGASDDAEAAPGARTTRSYHVFERAPPSALIRRSVVAAVVATGLWAARIVDFWMWAGALIASAMVLWIRVREARADVARRG